MLPGFFGFVWRVVLEGGACRIGLAGFCVCDVYELNTAA